MLTAEAMEPAGHVHVNAGRLCVWGVATAVVAALAVLAGVLVTRGVLGIPVLAPKAASDFGDSSTAVYAGLAAGCALLATALLHVLLLGTPRPFMFFAWIIGLADVVAAPARCGPLAAASGILARDRPPGRCAVLSVHPGAGPGFIARSRLDTAPAAAMIAARHCSPSAPARTVPSGPITAGVTCRGSASHCSCQSRHRRYPVLVSGPPSTVTVPPDRRTMRTGSGSCSSGRGRSGRTRWK